MTVKIGDKSQTFTLADLQAMPHTEFTDYEATGHKKGPLGANDWAGISLKDLLLSVDPTIADAANAGKFIDVTATDGWNSTLRWDEVFGRAERRAGAGRFIRLHGMPRLHG